MNFIENSFQQPLVWFMKTLLPISVEARGKLISINSRRLKMV